MIYRLNPRILLRLAPVWLCLGCKPPHPTLSLHDAVKQRNATQVESNLYWGCDVNAKMGEPALTPVQIAASVGALNIAKLLVERGSAAYVPEDAFFGNDPKTTAYLLDRKTLDASHAYALYLSALKGGAEAGVRYLASHRIDPNARDANHLNQSILHWFASNDALPYELRDSERFTAIFAALVDSGANVNATTNEGETPLGRAVEDGNEFAEKLLRAKGALQRGDQALESSRARFQAEDAQREQDIAEENRRDTERFAEEDRRREEEEQRLRQQSEESWRKEQAFLDDQDGKKSFNGGGD